MRTPTTSRRLPAADLVGAALLLLGGWVHLELYFDGYRSAGQVWLGRSFLANAVGSSLVAAALVLRPRSGVRLARLAGVAVAAGTLVAFALSRQGEGIFGFREQGLRPAPEAVVSLLVECGAVLALCVALLADRQGRSAPSSLPPARRASLAGAVLGATVALGLVWSAGSDVTPAPAGRAGDIAIADFAFAPPALDVPAGTTVTWTNRDGFAHSVVAGDGAFRSEALSQGAAYAFTFTETGTYPYLCGIHPSMTGTVTVA